MYVTKDTMTFSKPELRALLAHAGSDDTRPHLCGVAVDLARGRAFATDGHRLAMAQAKVTPSVTASVAACVVARDALERSIKACSSTGRIAIRRYALTEATAGSATVLGAGEDYIAIEVLDENDKALTTAHARIDQACLAVPVDQLLTPQNLTAPRCVWNTVNPAYLADLALVARAAQAVGVRCWAATAPLDPIFHDCDGETAYWQIVIMPVRSDESPTVEAADGVDAAAPPPTPEALPPANDAAAPKRRRKAVKAS